MKKMLNFILAIWLIILFSAGAYTSFIEAIPESSELINIQLEEYELTCKKEVKKGPSSYKVRILDRTYKYYVPKSFSKLDDCDKFLFELKNDSPLIISYKFRQTIWDVLKGSSGSTMAGFDVYGLRSKDKIHVHVEKSIANASEYQGFSKIFWIAASLLAVIILIQNFRKKTTNKEWV